MVPLTIGTVPLALLRRAKNCLSPVVGGACDVVTVDLTVS